MPIGALFCFVDLLSATNNRQSSETVQNGSEILFFRLFRLFRLGLLHCAFLLYKENL